ncbi:hypothetical protein K7887_22045 (plasmid) [Sutcliffiella horikoshii]|uniref:phage tail protein n=1 Tax=Sutcliffiella horikoshii TaxID=79883 RepID=UPI001CBCC236|nr:hypothetical protein [Sutcliffiella horikoshii]UAL49730.1 hypothetical protein K7887_22045 [Sutcliffiella horikoshii]
MEIFKLMGSIMVDSDKANDSIGKTEKKAEGLGSKFMGVATTVGKMGLAVGTAALAAGGAIFGLASKSGQAADRLLDLKAITGMSTDEIQRWEKVTKVAGVSTDAMTNASQKLTKTLDTMSEGTGKAAESAEALGFSYEELMGMNADERMNAITEALAGVDDTTERAKLGTDLLGGAWKDIAPIVDMGAESMQKAKDSANIVSEDDLNKANNFRIKVEELKDRFGHFAMMLGVQVVPIAEMFLDVVMKIAPHIQNFVEQSMQWIGVFVEYVKAWVSDNKGQINSLVEGFKAFVAYIVTWVSNNKALITEMFNNYKEYFSLIQELVGAFVSLVKGLWDRFGADILKIAKIYFDMIIGVVRGAFDVVKGLLNFFIGLFTGDWKRMGDGIKQAWSGVWDAVVSVVKGVWGSISSSLSVIGTNLGNWFSGLKSDAVRWGQNMIRGFIDGITAMIGKVREAASSVMSNVKSFLGFNSPAEEGEGRHIVKWGANMLDGFLEGAESKIPDARGLMNNVVGEMKPNTGSGGTASNSNRPIHLQIDLNGYTIAEQIYKDIDMLMEKELSMNLFTKGIKI